MKNRKYARATELTGTGSAGCESSFSLLKALRKKNLHNRNVFSLLFNKPLRNSLSA